MSKSRLRKLHYGRADRANTVLLPAGENTVITLLGYEGYPFLLVKDRVTYGDLPTRGRVTQVTWEQAVDELGLPIEYLREFPHAGKFAPKQHALQVLERMPPELWASEMEAQQVADQTRMDEVMAAKEAAEDEEAAAAIQDYTPDNGEVLISAQALPGKLDTWMEKACSVQFDPGDGEVLKGIKAIEAHAKSVGLMA